MTEAGASLSLASQHNTAGPSHATSPFPLSPALPTTPPVMPEAAAHRSRPLSEISENDNRRRSSRQSVHSVKGERSRPVSEAKEDPRRLSAHIATITLNLNDYASVAKRPPSTSAGSTKSRDSLTSPISGPSVNRITAKPERPVSYRTTSISSIKEIQKKDQAGEPAGTDSPKTGEPETKDGHPLLMARRASLRPSPLGATYADIAKSEPTTPSLHSPPLPPARQSVISLSTTSARSSLDSNVKPLPKSKPSWLRRASGQVVLRTKSKSPSASEENLSTSPSLPPELPPRRGVASGSAEKPPDHPSKTSYASIAAAPGPSRSRLGDGVGRPALSPPNSSQHPRDNNIRSRIAAWTTTAQQSGMSRSESSSTIATTASSAFTNAQQRLPVSAQRMIGSAGSAVQKGWAGLRARGMGGSISGMSSVAAGDNLEPPKFSRKSSRDRSVSAQATMGSTVDGPVLHPAALLRPAGPRAGMVFGRDITEVGKAWGVVDAGQDVEGIDAWEKRRRECLPAVVIRSVDYLVIWGPKEEGIFRISGRTSHLNRLRKEFDSGADIDMSDCHPGDLDPHAVSGLFKSYLRDLPSPLLTKELSPRFEAAVRSSSSPKVVDLGSDETDDLSTLLLRIPTAHWFLLADIVKLLHLIPSHSSTNRMTLNALMLSLGPSLNVPGTVLAEMLERREELFDNPPPVTGTETALDLIDFGDIPVALATIEDISRSSSPVSRHTPETPTTQPVVDKPRKVLNLPKKPSLSRLFNSSPNPSKKDLLIEPSPSVVPSSPPRVELRTDSPRLPSFESALDVQESVAELALEKELPVEPTAVEPVGSTETPYPSGSIEERAKAFAATSTPIADMYAASSRVTPRTGKSSNGSVQSSASIPSVGLGFGPELSAPVSNTGLPVSPANPASFIRRGPPIFFQSAGTERQARSSSGNGSIGGKRKDEAGGQSEAEDVGDESRVKRLSEALPSPVSVRDAVRSREMMA